MTDRSGYRPDIDGLRAVAVSVVVAYHAFPHALPGGFVGVDVFFVISGYLISGIILTALRDGRFTFAHFYARRIRRIFPALALVLAGVMIAGWFLLYADDYRQLGRHVAAGAAFASNFVLWQESSYFDTAAELKPLLHLWSLGIEEQFYLVWPLLLVIAARWTRGPMLLTLGIGTLSWLVAIWLVSIDRTAAFFAPWARFWELLAGAALACAAIDRELQAQIDRLLASQWLSNMLAIAGAVMIGAAVVLIDATRVFPGFWVVLPVGGSFLLLLTGGAWLNRVILAHPAVVWVGLISYPLYLWHWPLLSFARITAGEPPSATIRLLMIALSVMLSWLTYRTVEWPIRFGVPRRPMVPALSAAIVVLFAVGLTTNLTGGVSERSINRSDAAHLLDFYARLRKQGLRDAYRAECDFMDWDTESARSALDPSCTPAGPSGTVLLWGDSFAQALSLGLREQVPAGFALAQVATSACAPAIENFDVSVRDRRCEKANLYAMDSIRRLRPRLVILAQSAGHDFVDWPRIAARVIELGAGGVIVTGPFPLWRPSLPRVVAEHYMDNAAAYISTGIDEDQFTTDREVAATLRSVRGVTYVSLLQRLCRGNACLARVPDAGEIDLMALDHGHLTPKGSTYVGRAIFKPYLDRLLAP